MGMFNDSVWCWVEGVLWGLEFEFMIVVVK